MIAEGSLKGTIDGTIWNQIVGEVDKNGDGVVRDYCDFEQKTHKITLD